ncbi:MAG: hypothetical protein ABIR62_06260 [Dokdonella sp.]|uniref:hypothetical protein n=1 Tax=Dokdonella sp. TaxID=2291710 RepID=UPI0032677A1A
MTVLSVDYLTARSSVRNGWRPAASRFLAIGVGSFIALSFGGPPRVASAALPDRPVGNYVTNGPVRAGAQAGNTIYNGGSFDRIGLRTGPGVEVGPDGSQHAGLPEIAGSGPSAFIGFGGGLNKVIADGAGGWYVGGLFTHVGDLPRTNLAHILSDHSVDPNFHPVVDDAVHALALSGSTLYAAGSFTSVGGQTRNHIAALNVADGSLTAFSPNADMDVETLALSDDGSIVYAGGRFTTIGGLARPSLAALDPASGSAIASFNANVAGANDTGVVVTLAVAGSTLYAGGSFAAMGGQPRTNIAAVSLGGANDGVAVPGFNPDPSYFQCGACAQIFGITVSGSSVFVGGLYDTIAGQARSNLAELNRVDGTATSFDPHSNNTIFNMVISGSTMYISGGFNSRDGSPSIGGQPRNYVAQLNLADGSATAFNPNPNKLVLSIGVANSDIYLGGYFSSLGGVVRKGVAALNAADGSPTSFDTGPGSVDEDPQVTALAVADSTLYVSGYFSTMGGQPRAGIAALDTTTGMATGWDPGTDGIILSLAVSGSTVYAGGSFFNLGGQPRTFLGAIDAASGAATSWDPQANNEVDALVAKGPLLYVGGNFTQIGGQARNKLAALSAADAAATDWDPDATELGNVLALAISGTTIYAGGNFTSIHGVPRTNMVGIGESDGVPTPFDPQASDPVTGGGVSSIAVSGKVVYAGGSFSTIGGQPRNILAELNDDDGSATDFNPNGHPGAIVQALAVTPNGTLYAGGSFVTFDSAYQQGIAIFQSDVIFNDGFEGP